MLRVARRWSAAEGEEERVVQIDLNFRCYVFLKIQSPESF